VAEYRLRWRTLASRQVAMPDVPFRVITAAPPKLRTIIPMKRSPILHDHRDHVEDVFIPFRTLTG